MTTSSALRASIDAARFFPDEEAIYEAASAAARATGRRHVTVAFTIDYVLDHARAQMTRSRRRRFDRGREAVAAAIVAKLPPALQRDYHRERALMEHLVTGRRTR